MVKAYSAGLENNDAVRLAQRAKREGRVAVTTMNSSNGLEFDRVLMAGLNQDRIPSYHASKDPKQLPEERPKFYVSLTRTGTV